MFSCFHKSYCTYLSPAPKAFWYTNLLESLVWSLASRLDHDSVPARRTKCQIIFAVWCISTTQKDLGNSLLLLLSENIIATQNRYAWKTGNQKCGNHWFSANSGMRKLALLSICATFSPVTPPPPFSIDFWKADVKCNWKCILFKILSD